MTDSSQISKEQPKYETKLAGFTILLLLLASGLFVFAFFAPYLFTMTAWKKVSFLATGEIGDTIGGLMSPFINLSAVIVTGLAFYMQYRANQLQVQIFTHQLAETREQFKTEQLNQERQNKLHQFESQFFEMLRLHKENVDELIIRDLQTGKTVIKRQVFETMTIEFNTLLSYAASGTKLTELEYQVSYDIFFWGYDSSEVNKLSTLSQNLITGNNVHGNGSPIKFEYHKGFASSLGHYFRHLFMMVGFVVNSDIVTDYKDKMKYLKLLRAQLSNYEQIMLFYNWLAAGYGDDWENKYNRFFTDYKMVHNLWVMELFQNQYMVDAVNNLIDKYNQNPKETPLFEFQGKDFGKKMAPIQTKTLDDIF